MVMPRRKASGEPEKHSYQALSGVLLYKRVKNAGRGGARP